MTSSIKAIAAVLVLGAAATVATAPAAAQRQQQAAKPAAPQFKFSKPVQKLLGEAQKLDQAGDVPGSLAKLREAEALPNQTPDDQFVLAQLKYNAALKLKDNALLEQAAEQMLASDRAENKAQIARVIGSLSFNRGDLPRAAKFFEQALAANPADLTLASDVSSVYLRQKQNAQAYAVLKRSADAARAAGQPVSEDIMRRLLGIAYDGKLPETPAASLALVQAFPNAKNWRDALLILRDGQKWDDEGQLDIYRTMRATGALAGERDYIDYADTALRRGLPGEAKAALDLGVKNGALNATSPLVKELRASADPRVAKDRASLPGLEKESRAGANGKLALATGDSYLSYGDYAKAAEMYRLALQKGGIDADRANVRLGIALMNAGDRSGAQAAFQAVTGQRQQLAQFWMAQMAAPATPAAAA